MTQQPLRECPDCGKPSRLPALGPRQDARCPRCDAVLRRARGEPLGHSLAWVMAGLLFYLVMVTAPFLKVDAYGRMQESTLFTGPAVLQRNGLWALGAVVLATTVLLPFVKLLIQAFVLLGLHLSKPPSWLYVPFRWLGRMARWAMIEVFLLSLFVAYTRLIALVHVEIEVAAYALAGLMIATVAADAALDPDAVWETLERRGLTARPVRPRSAPAEGWIGCDVCRRVDQASTGDPCRRCGAKLRARKPNSLARTWALGLAALVLYLPANTYPVMTVVQAGKAHSYTILGGVEELIAANLWPLAVLVFLASIAVPVLKLISLGILLSSTHRESTRRLRRRTRLYRLVNAIGRWSMIDVFMVSILVALVRFGLLAQIGSGAGAVCFAAVVVLTMLATEGFDPRLMWDASGRNGSRAQAGFEHAPAAGASA